MAVEQKATGVLLSGTVLSAALAIAAAVVAEGDGVLWAASIAVVAVLCMGYAVMMLRRSAASIADVGRYAAALADGDLKTKLTGATHKAGHEELAKSMERLDKAYLYEMGLNKGLIEGLPNPFLLVDMQERALFTNQACLDMLQIGGTPQKQYGRTLAEIFYNDASRKTAVGQSIENGKVFKNLEVTITGHKGGQRHVLANVYPLYDMSGACIGGFCLYVDMTELKEKEAQLCAHNELIARSAERATDISNGLASAAEELSAQVEQSAATSREQKERTREVALGMEQMNSTVIEVATSAGNAASLAESAKGKAQEGESVVGRSASLMDEVYSNALKLREDMNALGEQAEGIGAVIDVINDIADQTNLLALNAAIEAARAGDAGRGFAVVADEVRKLAEKTMQATQEVTSAIGNIQRSTRNSMQSTESAAQTISENTQLATASGEVLREIVQLVEQTADNVRDIAAAAEEQSTASDEIAAATGHITHSAEENANAMHESSIAVGDLARMASELKRIIAEMRAQAPEECESDL